MGERIRYRIFDDDKPVGALDFDFSRADGSTLIIDRRQQLTLKRFMVTATLEAQSRQSIVDDRLVSFSSQSTLESTLKYMNRSLTLIRSDDGGLVGETTQAPISGADQQPRLRRSGVGNRRTDLREQRELGQRRTHRRDRTDQ